MRATQERSQLLLLRLRLVASIGLRVFHSAAFPTVLAAATTLTGLDRAAAWWSGMSSQSSLSVVATIALWGGHASVQALIGVGVAMVLAAATRTERRLGATFSAGRIISVGLAVIAAVPFYLTGRTLASGDWISQHAIAPFVAPIGALIGSGLFFFLGQLCFTQRSFRIRRFGAGVAAVVAVTAWLADTIVYPGLYLPLHRLAFGVSAAAMWFFWRTLFYFAPPSHSLFRRTLFAAAATVVGTALVFYGTATEKTRSELMVKSPSAAYLVFTSSRCGTGRLLRVLQRITDGRPVTFGLPPAPQGELTVPKDWNVLLIMADAMRADTLPPNRSGRHAFAKAGDTPFLDRWIENAYQFQYAYAPSNKTEHSIPSIFTGLYPSTLRKTSGTLLSKRMQAAGRKPFAVVNRLFASKNRAKLHSLLDGFQEKKYYSDTKQKDAVPTMLSAVDALSAAPFFAWFHFYCLHNPYYWAKGIQRDSYAPFRERYRRALRWFDGQAKRLFDELAKRGLLEKTVVVLTADHGEGLGDHRLETHGSYIFDEETRVPLYIYIPGRPGGLVSSTVHLVDLPSTLTALLGRPISNTDGESLVPFLINPKLNRQRDYYLENSMNSHMGVIRGRDKLVYFRDSDTLFRYELIPETIEKQNAYVPKGELDQLLTARLIYYRPDLFRAELTHSKTHALFASLYEKVDTLPPDAAALLRRLAASLEEK